AILTEKRSSKMIERFLSMLKENEVEISMEALGRLRQARRAMIAAESISDPQSALTAIVEMWELASPEVRRSEFRKASKDLFKFLERRSAKQLRCLKSRRCKYPFIFIAKNLRILPEIESYGVGDIKK